MKVILAGMSKCGTKTMVAALKKLDYNVYDFFENFDYLFDDWWKILEYGGTAEDFRRMYENVDAITDVPGNHFWEEIMEAFPDVKIILTQRRNDHEWVRSLNNQVVTNSSLLLRIFPYLSSTARRQIRYMDKIAYVLFGTKMHRSLFRPTTFNQLTTRQRYRQHTSYVKNHCPKNQLLIYDLKEGWGPLCKFLDKPIPKEPFPHENIKGGILDKFMKEQPTLLKMQREALINFIILVTFLVAGLSYVIYIFN